MFTQRSSATVSRRTALAGLGAGGAGLAVAASSRSVHAEGASLTEHPLAGAWLVSTSPGMATAICTLDQDGTALVALPICEDNGSGTVSYTTPGIGTWQSQGSRGGYVNVVQVLSHATGALVGTRSTHYFPVVSDDGDTIPAGREGTILGVWRGGEAFFVEFAEPEGAIATVRPQDLRRLGRHGP